MSDIFGMAAMGRAGSANRVGTAYSKTRSFTARDLGMLPGTNITARFKQIVSDPFYRDITIVFERKAVYTITDTVTIDIFRYSVDGNGCIFNFTINDKTKWGIVVTSSQSVNFDGVAVNGASPGANNNNLFCNIIMQCPTRDKNCNGLFIANVNGIGKPAHTFLERLVLWGFETGISFGDNAYMLTFKYTNIQFCTLGVFLDNTYTDIGERITFDSCLIGDCDLMIKNTSDQAMHFLNTSCDFSYKFFENNGQLYFNGCHIESPERFLAINDPTTFWGELTNNGSTIIVGSRMLLGSGATGRKNALFNLNGPFTYLNISECNVVAYATYMATGSGRIRYTGLKRYNNGAPVSLAKEGLNLYPDETCEYLPAKTDVFSMHINSDNSLDFDTLQPEQIVGGGWRFTHKTINQNSRIYIKIPTRGMRGGNLRMVINVPAGQASDAINYAQLNLVLGSGKKVVGANQSNFNLVAGDNTIIFTVGSMYNGTNSADAPIHDDVYIFLNTFKPVAGTQFIIKNIQLRPKEYE